jgi:hypothetical protein
VETLLVVLLVEALQVEPRVVPLPVGLRVEALPVEPRVEALPAGSLVESRVERLEEPSSRLRCSRW